MADGKGTADDEGGRSTYWHEIGLSQTQKTQTDKDTETYKLHILFKTSMSIITNAKVLIRVSSRLARS